jgi:hypothetical protein
MCAFLLSVFKPHVHFIIPLFFTHTFNKTSSLQWCEKWHYFLHFQCPVILMSLFSLHILYISKEKWKG